MRSFLRTALISTGSIFLTGCLAFGVPYTSDPRKKLEYSYNLLDMCRPLPAERLTGEALASYRESGDELGMAEAYHTFGNLYKGGCYHDDLTWKKHLVETMGSHEKRYEVSKENFQKAAELYEKHKDFMGAGKSYFGIANDYGILGNKQQACEFYDKALTAFNRDKGENPNPQKHLILNPTFKDAAEMAGAFKRKQGC